MAEPRVLKLQSPAYGEPIFYKWPLANTKKHDEATEITETIRLVCEDFPELKYAVENLMNDYDANDYESMNQLCQRYNKAIRNILALWKGRAPPPRMFKPPNKELLKHIINLCYSHAIKEPEKLNIYEPFSPEVYGETSFDMVAQILEECQNANDETFIDLGSGVGQVVLQAAASNQFKECFGVEKADTPAKYAQAMETEFKKWMDWFGKIYTDFTLEKGDFLEDKWQDVINNCGVVFVNNFAFGPVVNHHLKQRFQQMKEGARIISSREYCPLNFKFNKRNLSELGAMMRVTEMKPKSEEQTVSWTGNTVSYYLHVIDRTRLEKYFSILKKKKEGRELDEDELSIYSESNLSADTTGTPKYDETLEENLDGLYLGTTTRHQWQVLNDTIQQSRKDVKPKKKKPQAGGVPTTASSASGTSSGKVKKDARRPGRPRSVQKNPGHIQLKNKILQKYGYQTKLKKGNHQQQAKKAGKVKKLANTSRSSSTSSVSLPDTDDIEDGKTAHKENMKIPKKKKKAFKENASKDKEHRCSENGSLDDPLRSLDDEVDQFYDNMKRTCKEFIKRINTKEYADRLKVMIECEQTKKKLLQREVAETEQQVQALITTGLKSFSSRLTELDLAVKTPLELLSKSNILAERRQELENKVINMEVEVYNLEEKYRNMCNTRGGNGEGFGADLPMDLDELEIIDDNEHSARKNQLTTKLCGAIVNALNHRRNLIDKQSSLTDQISILEKIAGPQVVGEIDAEIPPLTDEERPPKDIPKPRPVAFVPPRMLSDDKKSTVSPPDVSSEPTPSTAEPQRRPRGRPRKRKPESGANLDTSISAQSDSSQDSKVDFSSAVDDERPRLHVEQFENHQQSDLGDEENNNHTSMNLLTSSIQPPSLHQQIHQNYDVYHTLEERQPIVFPTMNKLRDVDKSAEFNDNDKSLKEFLKASSKLLLNTDTIREKWKPLEELRKNMKMEPENLLVQPSCLPPFVNGDNKDKQGNLLHHQEMSLLMEPAPPQLYPHHNMPSIFSAKPPSAPVLQSFATPPQLPKQQQLGQQHQKVQKQLLQLQQQQKQLQQQQKQLQEHHQQHSFQQLTQQQQQHQHHVQNLHQREHAKTTMRTLLSPVSVTTVSSLCSVSSPTPISSACQPVFENAELTQSTFLSNVPSVQHTILGSLKQAHKFQQKQQQQQQKQQQQQHHQQQQQQQQGLVSPAVSMKVIKQPVTTFVPTIPSIPKTFSSTAGVADVTSPNTDGWENPTSCGNSQPPKYNIYDNLQLGSKTYNEILNKKGQETPVSSALQTPVTSISVAKDRLSTDVLTKVVKTSTPIKVVQGIDVKGMKITDTRFLLQQIQQADSRQLLPTNIQQLSNALKNQVPIKIETLKQQQPQQSFDHLQQQLLSGLTHEHQQKQLISPPSLSRVSVTSTTTAKKKKSTAVKKDQPTVVTVKQKRQRKRKNPSEVNNPVANLSAVTAAAHSSPNSSIASVDAHFQSSLGAMYAKDTSPLKPVTTTSAITSSTAMHLPPESLGSTAFTSAKPKSTMPHLTDEESVMNILRNAAQDGKLPDYARDYILQNLSLLAVANSKTQPVTNTSPTVEKKTSVVTTTEYHQPRHDLISTIDTTDVFESRNIPFSQQPQNPSNTPGSSKQEVQFVKRVNNSSSIPVTVPEQLNLPDQRTAVVSSGNCVPTGQSVIYHTKEMHEKLEKLTPVQKQALSGTPPPILFSSFSTTPYVPTGVIQSNVSPGNPLPCKNLPVAAKPVDKPGKVFPLFPSRTITDIHNLATALKSQPVTKKARKEKKKKPTAPLKAMSIIPANEMQRTMVLATTQSSNIAFLSVVSTSSMLKTNTILTASTPLQLASPPTIIQTPMLHRLDGGSRDCKTLRNIQAAPLLSQRQLASPHTLVNQPHFFILPVPASVPAQISVQPAAVIAACSGTTTRHSSATTSPTYPPPPGPPPPPAIGE